MDTRSSEPCVGSWSIESRVDGRLEPSLESLETIMNIDCYESQNALCKHHRATVAFYVNFNARLESGVLITECSADTPDEDLTVDACEVVDEDVTISAECPVVELLNGRAVKVTLSSGVPSDDEVIVTVRVVTDDDQEDFVDCRLLVGGVVMPG